METTNIYERLEFKNAETPFILHNYNFIQGQSLGHCNWHDSLEILYFTSGETIITYDAERIPVGAGEIIIVNSNVLHDVYAKTDMHFYCLIVDRKFCVSNYIDTSAVFFTKHLNDPGVCKLFEQFVDEFYDYDFPCRSQLLRSTALRLLAVLKATYEVKDIKLGSNHKTTTEIKNTLSYIHTHYKEKITLDTVSKVSGLSKYYLAHEFHKHVGVTIVEYLNHIRCENAKRLLQENQMSIADISVACGYPNPPYFTKTFLRNTGMRPKEYREKMLKINS